MKYIRTVPNFPKRMLPTSTKIKLLANRIKALDTKKVKIDYEISLYTKELNELKKATG